MINKVYNMDCMDYISNCKDKEFDLAIVDPPYGIYKNKDVTGFMKREYTLLQQATEWDIRPKSKYFNELFRISENQIIWGMQYFISDLKDCSQIIVWDKITGKNYFADAELAWCSIKGTVRIFKHRWVGAFKDSEHGLKAIQPCQKPIALYKWLITKYAKPGQTIFDSHVGSGSIRIACYDMGFDFIGTELDKDYFEAQEMRFQAHISQQELFEKAELQKIIFDK